MRKRNIENAMQIMEDDQKIVKKTRGVTLRRQSNKEVKGQAAPSNEPKMLLSINDLAQIMNLSERTVWKKVTKDPLFPKPVRVLSRNKRWLRSDVYDWLQTLSSGAGESCPA